MRAAIAAVVFSAFIAAPIAAPAQAYVGVGVTIAPPLMPSYAQPYCPTPNDQWTPGYWGWGAGGYYWVPGAWVAPPAVGMLWTPGYWGWGSNAYRWHRGYWGRSVGFYGGINYGFGYYGNGYVGGSWYGNAFRYNTAVTNVNRTVIHNTYVNETVVNRNAYKHVSYNGGSGGVQAQSTTDERAARNDQRPPTAQQVQHEQNAAQDGHAQQPDSASNRAPHAAHPPHDQPPR